MKQENPRACSARGPPSPPTPSVSSNPADNPAARGAVVQDELTASAHSGRDEERVPPLFSIQLWGPTERVGPFQFQSKAKRYQQMNREFRPHINDAGVTECAYAGCGREVPPDYYLCRRHYKQHQEGTVGPCPSEGCRRFRSLEYEQCADCGRAAAPEADPAWDAGDQGCTSFHAYLLQQDGRFYAGHTRDLRERLWEHRNGDCTSTSAGDVHEPAQLVWFQEFTTRSAAADRELELKQLLLRDRRAVLSLVFRFQDGIRHVSPLV